MTFTSTPALRAEIVARLLEMKHRSGMFAFLREGFAAQVWVYLELYGVKRDAISALMVRLVGNAFESAGEPLTEAFAQTLIDEALVTMGEIPLPPKPFTLG